MIFLYAPTQVTSNIVTQQVFKVIRCRWFARITSMKNTLFHEGSAAWAKPHNPPPHACMVVWRVGQLTKTMPVTRGPLPTSPPPPHSRRLCRRPHPQLHPSASEIQSKIMLLEIILKSRLISKIHSQKA